jgi:hypothetical protein
MERLIDSIYLFLWINNPDLRGEEVETRIQESAVEEYAIDYEGFRLRGRGCDRDQTYAASLHFVSF